MGAVWRAEHLLLKSHVAIKLISPELATTSEALNRFLREAQAAASLRSAHVVQILDYGVDEGTPYIAMELLDGESLGARLERVHCIAPSETAGLLLQVGRAVARAHDAGIVHRDLKPDNVFIVRNDEDEIAKVLDFGIAKLSRRGVDGPATGATRTGALLGTPYYMSPEQIEGSAELDHRSDVWAIGVIAYECLLGQRPFDAETMGGLVLAICSKPLPVPSARGSVPPGFDDWFARACHRDLEQRFASARDATRELKQLCEGSAVIAIARAEEPDSADEDQTEIYSPAAHAPKSVLTFSSSQSKTAPGISARAATALAAGALVIAATVGLIVWSRSKSALPLQPAAAAMPVATATTARAPAPAPQLTAAQNIVSLEALPIAEPEQSARPSNAKPAPARGGVAPASVDLEEAPSEDGPVLPENPYNNRTAPGGGVPPRPSADGF